MSTAMTGSDSAVTEMISDGKRMRAVWRPGDGHGDGTQHVIERTKNILRGHPTWKIFIDDIPQPFFRGSEQEPPHYIYLDDGACYAVWKSKQYTDMELKTYWPFDFDHQGNIKSGRAHRGRPAWVGSAVPEIAKGKLRGKNKWYEFSGEPKMTEYQPLRPKTKTKMELQVEAEWAAQNGQHAGVVNFSEGTPGMPSGDGSANKAITPGGTPITNTDNVYLASSTSRAARLEKVSNLRSSPPKYPPPPLPKLKQWQTPGRPIPPQSIKDCVKVRPITSSAFQSRSLDEGAFHMRSSLSPVASRRNSLSNPIMTPKRKVGPFLDSSSPMRTGSPEHKRAKVGERSGSLPAALPPTAVNASPSEGQLNQGERSSSLPLELSEPVPEVDSDSKSEDEFLANIGQALKRKRGQINVDA